mgnify:CR=1 FL=1
MLSRVGSFPCKKEINGGSEGKPSCKKPPRPPKAPNSLSSDAEKGKFGRSSDTILLMRTSSYSSSYSSSSSSPSSFSPRRRRMRSSSSSSSSSMWALIFTLLFATIIIGQGICCFLCLYTYLLPWFLCMYVYMNQKFQCNYNKISCLQYHFPWFFSDLWSQIHHQTLAMQASHGGVANLGYAPM